MKKLTPFLTFLLLLAFAIPTECGWNTKSGRDLDVTIDFLDYDHLGDRGRPVYLVGQPVRYRVSIRNNGKRGFKKFPIESTLVWSWSVTCSVNDRLVSYWAGDPLPGLSSSGLKKIDIPKYGVVDFNVIYDPPGNICPGYAEVIIDGGHGAKRYPSLKTYRLFEIQIQ